MSFGDIKDVINGKLLQLEEQCLNPAELLVLEGIYQERTYQQSAKKAGYSQGYFANVVAPSLFDKLGKVFGKKITKKNCKPIIKSYITEYSLTNNNSSSSVTEVNNNNLKDSSVINGSLYPSGAIPLDSPFYVRQLSLESQIMTEINKSGALVRIKAPQEMGKTSLLLRVLANCQQELGYKVVSLNLEKVDQSILEDSNKLLRWICANSARQLGLEPMLDQFWDEDMGVKMSWTIYFEDYLLNEIDTPLLLAIDEVNHVFEHPQVAQDFFPLLRSCYEEAKRVPLWQKLRLIIVHSTEIYVSLQLEQSPFNIGLAIELSKFNQQQIEELADKYQLNFNNKEELRELIDLVAGHPALIHRAFYHLSQNQITMSKLLETAATCTGIYDHHLQRHWINIQQQEDLAQAFISVYQANEPILLDPITAYKLKSMGLIHLVGNKAIVSCQLYKKYFESQISPQ